jgi:hypothetical protein
LIRDRVQSTHSPRVGAFLLSVRRLLPLIPLAPRHSRPGPRPVGQRLLQLRLWCARNRIRERAWPGRPRVRLLVVRCRRVAAADARACFWRGAGSSAPRGSETRIRVSHVSSQLLRRARTSSRPGVGWRNHSAQHPPVARRSNRGRKRSSSQTRRPTTTLRSACAAMPARTSAVDTLG